jgi:diguanylate cyclase (GGDEF)-like protein
MEQRRQFERVSRIREVLSAVNSAIVRIHEPEELCREACRIATTIGGLPIALVVILDAKARTAEIPALIGDIPRRIVETALRDALLDPEHATGVLAASLRAGRPVAENDVETSRSTPQRRALYDAGVRATASFPFTIDAAHEGSLLLGSYERNFFSQDEVELLTALSSNLSFALELAAKRERLDYLAYYDPLTELPNRTLALDRLGQEIAAAARRRDRLALLIFDVRQFDYLNTTQGATSGDLVLRTIAERLRRDVGQSRIARVGGDRFAILIPALNALRDVMGALGPDGLALLAEPLTIGERAVRLTAHVGCAVYPDDGDDAETIFRNAEAALQSAKAADAPYRFYSPQLSARLGERLELEGRLRRASDEGQFVLHYQPKVDFAGRTITGVEALIRWRDPERPGMLVPPAEFIPVLEQTGLIRDVGRWALAEAVRQHRAWNDAGLAAPRIAVNVSAVQLASEEFLADVTGAMRAAEGDPGLDLEVTESGLMGNVSRAIETLRSIRALGVEIAIDDFGTGYSSPSYILQLPISAMKIDRSFISEMTSEANKMTLVSTMIALGRELKLCVIAEGVETEEQAKFLCLLRCDQMQGFLFARPMPAVELSQQLPVRTDRRR